MPRRKQVKDTELLDQIEMGNNTDGILLNKHNNISRQTTNPLYIQKREGGGGKNFEFVDEGYMRQILNENFPIWSWEVIKYEFLGKEAVAVHGRLMIIDEGQPRYFDALAAHRMSISKQSGGYVDLGNDMKSANTEAFKVACNRLCNISDDVYRKSVLSEEQLDTIEGVVAQLDGQTKRKVRASIGNHTINPSTFDLAMDRLVDHTKIKEAK